MIVRTLFLSLAAAASLAAQTQTIQAAEDATAREDQPSTIFGSAAELRILPQTDRQSPRKAIRVLPAKRSGFSFESDQRSPLQAITLGLSGPPVIGKGER
jgi:hypothetical protein